jgi:hypothetical protein
MIYDVQLVLKNSFGEFTGKWATIDEEKLNVLIEMSKTFYVSGGFELTCEDDTFIVFPPDIVSKSILIINRKVSEQSEENKEENVQE